MSQSFPPDQGQPQPPYQQPSYPQQQPQYPPFQQPMQQPPKKRSFLRSPLGIGCGVVAALFILVIVIVIIASAASGGGNPSTSNSTTGNTPASGQSSQTASGQNTPATTPKWTTVQKFTGSGIKKTSAFTVPDHWRLLWSCDPASFGGSQYNLIVDVYNTADTSLPQDSAVNVLCGSGATHDSTELYHGGTVYLDINSEAAWTLTVQILK